MKTSEPISSRLPESFEYSNTDNEKRAEYFYEMYQNAGAMIDIPHPLNMYEDEGEIVPDDEHWLQAAAHNAHTALMDALAGLIDITSEKAEVG